MPYRNDKPPLPFLDPDFDPNHPANNPPVLDEDPYLPLTPTQRKKRQAELLAEALKNYEPPHVLRSWEVDTHRAQQREDILRLELKSRPPDLVYREGSKHRRSISQPRFDPANDDRTDFRRFAEIHLHLGYWRFHLSTDTPDPEDPPDFPPEDVCWIMEYTYPECSTIRRKIALAMGLLPAAIDNTIPAYNVDIDNNYDGGRRLISRCQRRNRFCIRPSHIIIAAYTGEILP